ncbi:hypothetical protein CRYUN_Cryun33cG0045900 [Craigia yunnanensis]
MGYCQEKPKIATQTAGGHRRRKKGKQELYCKSFHPELNQPSSHTAKLNPPPPPKALQIIILFKHAMPTPSDPSNSEVVYRRQNKGPPFKFLVPLVYAPVLPLIRLSLRKNPVLRDRLFTIVLVGAFVHGSYLVSDLYDAESK